MDALHSLFHWLRAGVSGLESRKSSHCVPGSPRAIQNTHYAIFASSNLIVDNSAVMLPFFYMFLCLQREHARHPHYEHHGRRCSKEMNPQELSTVKTRLD